MPTAQRPRETPAAVRDRLHSDPAPREEFTHQIAELEVVVDQQDGHLRVVDDIRAEPLSLVRLRRSG